MSTSANNKPDQLFESVYDSFNRLRQYKNFTPEEIAIRSECRRKATLSVFLGAGAGLGITRILAKPRIQSKGVLLLLYGILGSAGAYGGMIYAAQSCLTKFLKLENSVIGDELRKIQKAAQNNGRWGKGCPLEESKKRSSGESDQKSFPESDSVPFSGEKKQKRYNKYGDEIED